MNEELLKEIEKAKKEIEKTGHFQYFYELRKNEKESKKKINGFSRISIINFYCSDSKYLNMSQEEINKDIFYRDALVKVLEEDEFEQRLHRELLEFHEIPLPFYVKINKRKNARVPGCYTRPGASIEIAERYYKNRKTGEVDYCQLRRTLLHEYAHHLHNYYTNFEDGGAHGWIFQTILFILYRLASEKGYLENLMLDEDHLKNFQLKNPYFKPLCEKMGYDYEEIMKPDFIIKTSNPNFHVHVY